MRESSFWANLKKKMQPYWKAERIENEVALGTPDVYYTMKDGQMGWIELKYLKYWPKKKETKVKIDHYTNEQRNWIRRHGGLGAQVHLFIQVDKDYLLFDWESAQDVGRLTKEEMFKWCQMSWINIDAEELSFILSKGE